MQSAERGIVNLVQESYGGAIVLFLTPVRADGVQLPTSVVKVDRTEEIAAEVRNTREYGPYFGLLHPAIMEMKTEGELSAMQLELCGGVHGLADLARGLQVLRRHPGFEAESLKPLRYGTV